VLVQASSLSRRQGLMLLGRRLVCVAAVLFISPLWIWELN